MKQPAYAVLLVLVLCSACARIDEHVRPDDGPPRSRAAATPSQETYTVAIGANAAGVTIRQIDGSKIWQLPPSDGQVAVVPGSDRVMVFTDAGVEEYRLGPDGDAGSVGKWPWPSTLPVHEEDGAHFAVGRSREVYVLVPTLQRVRVFRVQVGTERAETLLDWSRADIVVKEMDAGSPSSDTRIVVADDLSTVFFTIPGRRAINESSGLYEPWTWAVDLASRTERLVRQGVVVGATTRDDVTLSLTGQRTALPAVLWRGSRTAEFPGAEWAAQANGQVFVAIHAVRGYRLMPLDKELKPAGKGFDDRVTRGNYGLGHLVVPSAVTTNGN